MDEFDFNGFQKDIDTNFYKNDFDHMNIYAPDGNNNTAGYRDYNDGDILFNQTDDYDSDDSLDFL